MPSTLRITPAEADMRDRWRPTPEQIMVAKAMLAAHPTATCVLVPQVLPGKTRSCWDVGQTVEAAPGFWLADRTAHSGLIGYGTARNDVIDAAVKHLGNRPGTGAYASIERDGVWSVFEA